MHRIFGLLVAVLLLALAPAVAQADVSANAGGPYWVEEGTPLVLGASGSAGTYSWDLNGDGTFGDASGASPTVAWAQLAALGLDGPANVGARVRVTDGTG